MHQVATRYFIYHTHHWQKATQHGKTTGLRNFLRFFNAPQRESMGKDRVEMQGLAMEQLSQAVPLRAVEGRLAPPSRGRNKYLPWLLAFAKQAKEDKLDKFGIVVHFRKKDHEPFEKERTFTAVLNLRHGKIRRLTESDAFRLFRLLSTPDPVVPFIVGIDAANLELTTPPEVFAPAFRFLREYPIELRQRSTTRAVALEQYEDVASLVKKRRLGMTYHVGEDFRHLLSGLRAIDEVIEFLKPLPGDRLGHAIALALDPEVWAAQVGYQSVIPTQEWLDTLVWIHSLLGPGHDLIGQLSVEDRIQRYSRQIYGKIETDKIGKSRLDLTPPTLCDSWRLRQLDPYSVNTGRLETGKFSIRLQGYGNEHKRWADVQSKVLEEVDRYVGMESAYELVKYYWYDSYVRKMGDWCITVDMKAKRELWINVCREIQEKLQEKVRARQLVVEVNPSSNRVVGPMERMADHPVFRLTLDKQNHLARESRVTINTDDPGVFATSLAHEFYLLGESLLNRGVPEAEVEKWLDWLRKNGEDYSFLRSLPGAGDSRVENILNKLIKRNERLLRHLRGERRKYVPLESRIGSKWMGIRQTGDTDKSEQLEAAVKYLLEKIRTLEEERKAVR
ncbi:MAG: hypothetical protein GY950_09015 [bacterium]|nr:hypothetical protein [bacterium]